MPLDPSHIEVYEPPCPLPPWLYRDRQGRIDWRPGARPKTAPGGGVVGGAASPPGPTIAETGGRP